MATLVQESHTDWIMSPGAEAITGTVVGQLLEPGTPEFKAAKRIYDLGLCHKCGIRKGTGQWADGDGALALTHGFAKPRCDTCTYGAQFEHAWGRTKALPGLAYRLVLAKFSNT